MRSSPVTEARCRVFCRAPPGMLAKDPRAGVVSQLPPGVSVGPQVTDAIDPFLRSRGDQHGRCPTQTATRHRGANDRPAEARPFEKLVLDATARLEGHDHHRVLTN